MKHCKDIVHLWEPLWSTVKILFTFENPCEALLLVWGRGPIVNSSCHICRSILRKGVFFLNCMLNNVKWRKYTKRTVHFLMYLASLRGLSIENMKIDISYSPLKEIAQLKIAPYASKIYCIQFLWAGAKKSIFTFATLSHFKDTNWASSGSFSSIV